ncbi:MAG: aldo/keto reductase [Pseudomonadota bacterium]|nr:MAG: aldo/keto reductase [Pseudomonadota bacterium]
MKLSRRNTLKFLLATGASVAAPQALSVTPRPQLRRPIPRSNEQLPVVGLGTWQTFDVGGSDADHAPLREVLREFVRLGGSVIDSSPMYGTAEEVVGDLANELDVRSRLWLATKVWTTGRAAGIRQMESSLSLLRVKRIDLMQVHNLVDWQTHIKTLRVWKEQGRVRYIGITHYHSGAYDELERVMKEADPDFVQLNYSIVSREAERRLLPLAAERRMAVLINRPFETGGLFGKVRAQPLPAWAADFDCASWAQFFLKFILAHPAVTCVIPATSKVKHLSDNMRAGFGRLPDSDTREKMAAWIARL